MIIKLKSAFTWKEDTLSKKVALYIVQYWFYFQYNTYKHCGCKHSLCSTILLLTDSGVFSHCPNNNMSSYTLRKLLALLSSQWNDMVWIFNCLCSFICATSFNTCWVLVSGLPSLNRYIASTSKSQNACYKRNILNYSAVHLIQTAEDLPNLS